MEDQELSSKWQRWNIREHLRDVEIASLIIVVVLAGVGLAYRGTGSTVSFTRTDLPAARATTPAPLVEPVPEKEIVVTPMTSVVVGSPTENIATADPKIFKAPENFKTFSYDKNVGKRMTITGTCGDSYYALLIFKSTDDYRKDPARAYYNTAYECPKTKIIALDINLQDFNLPTGEYYMFIADQGEKGSWYNPR